MVPLPHPSNTKKGPIIRAALVTHYTANLTCNCTSWFNIRLSTYQHLWFWEFTYWLRQKQALPLNWTMWGLSLHHQLHEGIIPVNLILLSQNPLGLCVGTQHIFVKQHSCCHESLITYKASFHEQFTLHIPPALQLTLLLTTVSKC